MDELIDIVDEHGNLTGKSARKSEIHSKGYYHNTAHLWLFTSEGKILLQQRAASKLICPLLWDVSVAGHIDAGESPEEGIIRETFEEIGLNLNENQLRKIGVFECFQIYDNGIIDNEFHHTFIAKTNFDILQFTPQKEEVEALKYITVDEFQELIFNIGRNNHFIASNKAYYQVVLKAVLKQLK